MLEHVAAVGDVEGLVGERQLLARADRVLDVEALRRGVGARRLDRLRGGVDAGHAAAEPRELLREQAAAGADVQCGLALRVDPELLDQHAAHVAEARRVDARAQQAEHRVVVPPRVGEAVVELVVDRHAAPRSCGAQHRPPRAHATDNLARVAERDPNCIFCKVVAGEIPGEEIDSDERTMTVLDINPATRGHAVVITRDARREPVRGRRRGPAGRDAGGAPRGRAHARDAPARPASTSCTTSVAPPGSRSSTSTCT